MTCMVMGDAAKLLTHTLPERDLCSEEAYSQLSMVEADMFSTSPLPMEIPARSPKDNIFATAITVKSFKHDLGYLFAVRIQNHRSKGRGRRQSQVHASGRREDF